MSHFIQEQLFMNPEPPNIDDMMGDVYMVPNKHWGFEAITTKDHPGIFLKFDETQRTVLLLKGTSFGRRHHPKYRASSVIIYPDEENGLTKPTIFSLIPKQIRLRKVSLYYGGTKSRYIGKLSQADFQYLLNQFNVINKAL